MGRIGAVMARDEAQLEPHALESWPTMSAHDAAIRAFSDVAGALSDMDDLDELLHLIASKICALAQVPRCSVYLRDDETGFFRGQIGHAERNIDAAVKRLVAGTEADRFTEEIVRSKGPVFVRNALEDPRPIRSTMRTWNIRAMLGVPMVLRGEVIGIFFLDDEGERHSFSDAITQLVSTFANLAAVAISQAQMTTELRRSLATVARQNTVLRRASAVDDRLSALALEGAGFAEIALAVAELTAKPCAIYDAKCRMLASATPSWLESSEAPHLPGPSTWAHPAVQAALGQLAATRNVVEPVREAGLLHRYLVAPISTRETSWGLLAIIEHGTRFSPLDGHIARRAATQLTLEMSAERRVAHAEWDARASLVSELIRGNRDVPALERRAQYFGVDLAGPRVVCLVAAAAAGDGTLPAAAEISTAFREVGDDGVLAAGVAEGVVLTLDLDPALAGREAIAKVRARVERGLAQLAGRYALIAAISACCRDVRDYMRAFGEAKQVMTCLTTLADAQPSSVLTADDLGPGRLFLASADRADAERFARDALGALLAPQPGMGDLLRTLRVFFDSSRSVRHSAKDLDVHENTIRYRLARVEELTGLAVASSSEDQLTVQLALLILRICGWEPAPAPAAQLCA
jgi:sugar diacid utilization regulator